MRISALCTAVVTYVVVGHPPPAVAQVDQQRAQEYFKEAQALCERDGGRLWGVSICGPMVIADRRTQTIATSQPAPEGARPRVLGIVNAPVQWGGATWSAYMWHDVVNRTPRERNELFLHELFHCVQGQLGLAAPALDSEHLDAADGRYWLRLEWRALARALRESGEQRNLAVRDALAFRQARRMLYAANVESERGQEITEGLAAYTGTVLAAASAADAIGSAIDLLANTEAAALQASFVRTFAYMSGPAYGLLLDASSPGWTRTVRGTDDLGTLVMRALAVVTLKRVAIGGGSSQMLARLQGASRGASWGTDGTIIAATALESSGLIRVSDNGGDPNVLTVPDTQRGERDHLWPHHLPDGKSILFTVTSMTGGRDAAFVAVLNLESGRWRPVLRAASQAKYLQSGHLLYVAGEALWVVPFDVSRLQTTGPARVVVPHVLILPTGTAEFAVAPDGTLAYVADTAAPTRRRMVWVDRNGREEEITDAPPRVYAAPRLSPDGSRIALEIGDGDHDIWVWDSRRRALTQVTTGPAIEQAPLWSADGERLFFTSTAGGTLGTLLSQAADGSGTAEGLTESRNIRRPTSVLPDNTGVIGGR